MKTIHIPGNDFIESIDDCVHPKDTLILCFNKSGDLKWSEGAEAFTPHLYVGLVPAEKSKRFTAPAWEHHARGTFTKEEDNKVIKIHIHVKDGDCDDGEKCHYPEG